MDLVPVGTPIQTPAGAVPEYFDADGRQLEPLSPTAAAEALADLGRQARIHRENRRAENTKRYNASDWAQYELWCYVHRQQPLTTDGVDPILVGRYVTDLARQVTESGLPRYKASSIKRHIASLSRKHFETTGEKYLGAHAAIADVILGIERERAAVGERRQGATPLLLDDIKHVISCIDHDLYPAGVTAARDTLLILIGFATAARRSELASRKIGDTTLHPLDGLVMYVGQSKGDQAGLGVNLPIPFSKDEHGMLRPSAFTCGPCAWVRWLRLVEVAAPSQRSARQRLVYGTDPNPANWQHICKGDVPELDPALPLFPKINKAGYIGDQAMTPTSVNAVIKRRVAAAGYDPGNYSAHSLRAGMVTQARRNNADYKAVRKTTRHKSDAQVDVYDDDWNPLEGAGVNYLGL